MAAKKSLKKKTSITKAKRTSIKKKKMPNVDTSLEVLDTSLDSSLDEGLTSSVPLEETSLHTPAQGIPKKFTVSIRMLLVLVLILGLGAILLQKGYIVAAFVNGRPIFRWDVTNELVKRFGAQTLEGIIAEKLILQEALKAQVTVSQQEIEEEQNVFLSSFGQKVPLDTFLTMQGLTKEDFDYQVKLQLLVKKIIEKENPITDEAIESFIASNSAFLVASEAGAMREEAKRALSTQQNREKGDTWLQEVQAKSSIQKLLK